MGTKLLLGFGGTVIQVVVHQVGCRARRADCFGGTVIQVVVHPENSNVPRGSGFGGTVIQVVVHLRIKWAL